MAVIRQWYVSGTLVVRQRYVRWYLHPYVSGTYVSGKLAATGQRQVSGSGGSAVWRTMSRPGTESPATGEMNRSNRTLTKLSVNLICEKFEDLVVTS